MIERPLFDVPDPAPQPGPLRCEEPGCGRPIRSPASLRPCADGRRRGAECRRRYQAARRVPSIPTEPAWHVPGQTEIPIEEET